MSAGLLTARIPSVEQIVQADQRSGVDRYVMALMSYEGLWTDALATWDAIEQRAFASGFLVGHLAHNETPAIGTGIFSANYLAQLVGRQADAFRFGLAYAINGASDEVQQ